jgi:hypothetical protein
MTKYDEDFYTWTQAQANYVRAGVWMAVDVEHVAEEIEALGKSDWRALESHLKTLILHCLKWAYQPQERARRGRGWQTSMDHARDALEQLLRDNPSFHHRVDAAMAWAYPKACRDAAKQTGLLRATFPADCQWRFDDLMNEGLWREVSAE